MDLYLVFILCTWTWNLVHGRSWVWFMSPYVTVSPRFFIYIWLFWRASIIVIQSHGRVMYSTNERERESGDLLFSRYSTHIYIICYIAKLLNYFYISYNFSKRMFVQKIIYIFVHFLWQSICIYTDWVRFSMECQHHFDRAYIYIHTMFIITMLGSGGTRPLPAGLISTAVNLYGGCSMVKQTLFKKSRLK